jgi:hypoxanthine phosphoribosyltransferase
MGQIDVMDIVRANTILSEADCVVDAAACRAAVERLARDIKADAGADAPLVLAVMGGATVFAGQLLPLLDFPLDFDYIHVSRYGGATTGGHLAWKVEPKETVKGRTVIVLDDILDEGETMHAIRERILELGAKRFIAAVFCEKDLGRAKPIRADFTGVIVPNRYVFGYGMDVNGLWRNLPAVYAVKGL